MYNRGDALKALNIGQCFVCKLLIIIPINAVLNDVFAAILFSMDLQIEVIAPAPCNYRGKRALADISVLPCQRVDIFDSHIVQHNAGCIAGYDLAVLVDLLPHYAGNVCHRAKRRLHFLHLIRLNSKIVLRQDAVNKFLLLIPFKRYLHFFVHEQIRPILAQFLSHSKGIPLAVDHAFTVTDAVIVEALYISLIPAFPLRNLAVKRFGDRGIAKLVKF